MFTPSKGASAAQVPAGGAATMAAPAPAPAFGGGGGGGMAAPDLSALASLFAAAPPAAGRGGVGGGQPLPTITQPQPLPVPTYQEPETPVQAAAPKMPAMPSGFTQYGAMPEFAGGDGKPVDPRFEGLWQSPTGNVYNSNTEKWTTKDGSPLSPTGMAGDANRAIDWYGPDPYAGGVSAFNTMKEMNGAGGGGGTAAPAVQMSDAQKKAQAINDAARQRREAAMAGTPNTMASTIPSSSMAGAPQDNASRLASMMQMRAAGPQSWNNMLQQNRAAPTSGAPGMGTKGTSQPAPPMPTQQQQSGPAPVSNAYTMALQRFLNRGS